MSAPPDIGEQVTKNKVLSTDHDGRNSGSSSSYDKPDEAKPETRHDDKILDLVRRFTARSAQENLGSPFDAVQDSGLNPRSDHFRAKSWARAFYNLRYEGEEALQRVAGIAFKDLDVWGKGSPTDFQSTVGNKILKLPSVFGRGAQRIEILRNLDGLILPGEQLCVLGPPG